ncbi:MAG: hypothetical protein J5643_01085 [Lachnospiraceae bacterium]|nr:hypothetical protein [Lachnospiraceae bacterium]
MFSLWGKQKAALLIVFSMIAGLLCHYSSLTDRDAKGSRSVDLLRNWYKVYQTEGNPIAADAAGPGGEYSGCDSLNPGSQIWVIKGVKNRRMVACRVSIGYRAYKVFNGVRANGFVTVGHGVREARDSYVYRTSGGSGIIGRIEVCKYSNQADASFISLLNQNTVTQKTPNGISISSNVYKVKNHDRVCMYGGVSGYIPNVEVCGFEDAEYDGITLKDTIVTELMSVKGDSGSPVFYKSGSTYRLVGIVVADNDISTAIEPESRIRSAIGAIPY